MLSGLSRRQKRYFFLAFDSALVPLAFLLAYCLRFSVLFPAHYLSEALPLIAVMTVFGPFIMLAMRLPWIKLTSLDMTALSRIAGASALLIIIAMACSFALNINAPRSIPFLFGGAFFVMSVMGRNLGYLLVSRSYQNGKDSVPVAIYGAGAAGIQLAAALRASSEVEPVAFVDDNANLHGLIISGLSVSPPAQLGAMVESGQVKRVLLAMPSLPQAKTDAILADLHELDCDVQVLPSYVDLISGQSTTLQPVAPDALLGRDKVDLDVPDIAKAYAGRVVMVTGAGGSIGSELCRQLLDCAPARIVLYEQSEFALYQIDRELRVRAEDAQIGLSARLGSVTNPKRLANVLKEEGIEAIIHAAAYKHVPLVEDNVLEGAGNNLLGTQIVASAAEAQGVERFILVSTDKAVRPTNIMGATKRMAEMVVQDMASRTSGTRFSMVRFGNVLGSSGSVLPLFQDQIRSGGPVTVTHPEVTRFFMTIPEAARLVLLAGAYSEGGDVFVLDMGKPMKILDIARRMIELSGARVRHGDEAEGIEIKITGLRPGEKLYEELLIDDASLIATPHSKILRASEDMLSQIEVAAMLREARGAVESGDADRFRKAVEGFVKGYQRPMVEADSA
ncbi:polysaccharide biosynthesis protein [Gymnodinialimonas hymeniacidonis]|uniref:polysaccharide biosynthesis protein n=1 Tax=Gymnodinialimonas hymeniacidonis TaxID=3126508 RepID=UPI0034C5E72E